MDRYFNNDAIGIIEANADFRITRANRGACRILGYSAEELCQLTWADFTHPDDIQKITDHFMSLFEAGQLGQAVEVRHITKSGAQIENSVNVQAGESGPDGRPSYYVAFIMDITRLKQAERALQDSARSLSVLHEKIGHALNDAVQHRDPYTADHQSHVARLASRMCDLLGLPMLQHNTVVAAAGVHDVGKIAIPNEYLTKPAKLDELEFAVLRTHAQHGFQILRPMEIDFPVAEIVYQHHERLDGSGYPRGLCNGAIMIEAQIIAAADTVDAIINARPYRRALGKDHAIRVLTEERGLKLGADIADACITAIGELP
ncbi:MAG: PAS domain S-box protein [Rhodospirillaceae bacterium]|nr:MAG: PAS domain S-box protein [Rhodospirillaceae bacterium]